MHVNIRKAQPNDMNNILCILESAREFLERSGSSQWQNGYGPKKETIISDIKNGYSYVFEVDDIICGYSAITDYIDENYSKITNGSFDDTYKKYASIHRVAISSDFRRRGLSEILLNLLVDICQKSGFKDIRIDTHEKNIIMQKTLKKVGFLYKGIINLPIPDGKRLAYQKII